MIYQNKENTPFIDQEVVFHQALQHGVNHLRDNWFKENVGIVAATLVEDGKFFSATSFCMPDNRWVHAEAAALQQFENQFGRKPKPSSALVVTLSPCYLESNSRSGASCTQKIVDSSIKQVRFGCLDIKQTPDIALYKQIGLDAKFIGDQSMQISCQALYALFDKLYSPDGIFHDLLNTHQNPWSEIKRIIGLEPFQK